MTNSLIDKKLAWGLAELADALSVSVAFLRKEQRSGRLPVKRLGRRVIVTTEDLQRYLSVSVISNKSLDGREEQVE